MGQEEIKLLSHSAAHKGNLNSIDPIYMASSLQRDTSATAASESPHSTSSVCTTSGWKYFVSPDSLTTI